MRGSTSSLIPNSMKVGVEVTIELIPGWTLAEKIGCFVPICIFAFSRFRTEYADLQVCRQM